MTLVDTSVWVEHLRRGRSDLAALLSAGEVACHPFVVGELACGRLRQRREILGLLAALPPVEVATHEDALSFVEAQALAGRGLGWVDVHLLASARLSHVGLWTLDGALDHAARDLGVSSR